MIIFIIIIIACDKNVINKSILRNNLLLYNHIDLYFDFIFLIKKYFHIILKNIQKINYVFQKVNKIGILCKLLNIKINKKSKYH